MKFCLVIILALSPLLGLAQSVGSVGSDYKAQNEAMQMEMELEMQRSREDSNQTMGRNEEVAVPFDTMEELKKIGHSGITPGTLLDEKAIPILERTLKEARLSNVPPEVMKEKILESMEGHPLKGFILKNPRILDFIVDVMRDEKVLISGLNIFRSKPRLKIYFYLWIGIMFAAYFGRRLFISKFWPKPLQIFAGLLFSMTISTITLSTFCLIFESEMKPIISIVKKHL